MKCLLAIFALAMTVESSFAFASQYDDTRMAEVCTIPLPITGSQAINRMALGLKHVFLKIEGETYGMPFTNQRTYFGGDAFLYNEDPFYKADVREDEKCYPVQKKVSEDESSFFKKVQCVAKKLSMPLNRRVETERTWYPIFDYHALKNNCNSMVNFVVQCAGGKVGKMVNLAIGDGVPMTKKAKLIDLLAKEEQTETTYGALCARALIECEDNGDLL